METELSKAVETLCKALSKDKSQGSYYFGWQSNIAVQMQDEFERQFPLTSKDMDIHKVSNEAAKNFLDLLITTTLDKESLNHE